MPNAMVCIPRKLHEVTIKPTNQNPTTVPKGLLKKGVPIGKTVAVAKLQRVIANPFAGNTKTTIKPVQKVVMKPHLKLVTPISIQKPSKSNIPSLTKISNTSAKVLKDPIRIQNPKGLSNLPSSITVKRTTQPSHKPIFLINTSNLVKTKPNILKAGIEVPTVELDDDEGTPTSGPAWYLRPEELAEAPDPEEENNKEPEPPTMIEITIEDSPIKPVINKRTCEIGAELTITIDDSPIKTTIEKNESASGSDNEDSTRKEAHSKKKLEYPKEAEYENRKTVEIEIDIPPVISEGNSSTGKHKNVDYEEVTIVSNQTTVETSKKEDESLENRQMKNDSTENRIVNPSSSKSEFHSVYQSFIDVCFQLENSDDMTKIVEKKIKGYYRQVPKEYTESEEFVDMVASKIVSMKANPEKMYLYIKDIVDELNLQRKLSKSQIVKKESKTDEGLEFFIV